MMYKPLNWMPPVLFCNNHWTVSYACPSTMCSQLVDAQHASATTAQVQLPYLLPCEPCGACELLAAKLLISAAGESTCGKMLNFSAR